MGYRSNVRIKILKSDFIKLKDEFTSKIEEWDFNYNMFNNLTIYRESLELYYDENGDEMEDTFSYFGWNYVKWYDDYEDVSFIMDYIRNLKMYAYCRIGESSEGDIESDEYNIDQIDYSIDFCEESLHNTIIDELNLENGFDSHEEVGFELAKAYLANPDQNFTELRRKLYDEMRNKCI